MPNKALAVSIVIPVYNEENYLKACLDAIDAQTTKPLEVLVVDNNSTDRSSEIAKKYLFVTMLHEKRQGQVYAQATGFEAASSAIIARLDGDTILPPNWVADVLHRFDNENDLVALTGPAHPYDLRANIVGRFVFRLYHQYVARLFYGYTVLWGANCAFRANYWPEIVDKIPQRTDIWEDFELSYWLHRHGRIAFVTSLPVGCSFRAAHKTAREQTEYQWRVIRTYRLHHSRLRTTLFFAAWATMVIFLPFALLDGLLNRTSTAHHSS